MKQTFIKWLKDQKDRQDPIGDLSRDLISDKDFKYGRDYIQLYDHMLLNSACDDAIDALKQALMEYNAL